MILLQKIFLTFIVYVQQVNYVIVYFEGSFGKLEFKVKDNFSGICKSITALVASPIVTWRATTSTTLTS